MSNAEVMQIAFPGIQAQIDDIFAAEDSAVRLTFRGTHRGEFLGIAPTGRDVVFMSLEHYRVVDGQLAEEWISSDLTTLMRQLTEPDPKIADLQRAYDPVQAATTRGRLKLRVYRLPQHVMPNGAGVLSPGSDL